MKESATVVILVFLSMMVLAPSTAAVKEVYNYTGSPQQFTVPENVERVNFTLEGAGGGDAGSPRGGDGGVTTGKLNVSEGETFELYVGGAPTEASDGADHIVGGWNGGGWGDRDHHYAKGGGGGTDIRFGGNTCNDRIAVAGGGGGESWSTQAGHGGGTSGGDGGGNAGKGGTQNSGGNQGGSFCSGGSNKDASDGTGAGGGGWYGGGRGSFDDPGGGGSGYCADSNQKIVDCSTSRGGGGSGNNVPLKDKHGAIILEYVEETASNPPVIESASTTDVWKTGEDISVEVNSTDPDGNLDNVTATVWEDGTKIVDNSELDSSSGNWTNSSLFNIDETDVFYNLSLTATDTAGVSSTTQINKYVRGVQMSWNHDGNPLGFRIYSNASETGNWMHTATAKSITYGSSLFEKTYTCFNVTAYNTHGESGSSRDCDVLN